MTIEETYLNLRTSVLDSLRGVCSDDVHQDLQHILELERPPFRRVIGQCTYTSTPAKLTFELLTLVLNASVVQGDLIAKQLALQWYPSAGFPLTTDDVRVLVVICERLDFQQGADAWMRLLPPGTPRPTWR